MNHLAVNSDGTKNDDSLFRLRIVVLVPFECTLIGNEVRRLECARAEKY